MDNALIIVPISMLIILGAATQLQEIAQSSADKTIAFSDDMNGAMECASKGIPLRECSPDLFSHDLQGEQEALIQTLEELQNQGEVFNISDLNATIINISDYNGSIILAY